MGRGKRQSSLRNRVLQGAFVYLVLFFVLFFFTDWVGTKLNWLFWLLPPFYALYISQLGASDKLLKQLVSQRLPAVTVLSFIGTSFVYVSFPFIIIFTLELLTTFWQSAQHKSFPTALWSLLLLITPLIYLIITRMYYAGQLGWITTGITCIALVLYWFLKRSGTFKRLFVPK